MKIWISLSLIALFPYAEMRLQQIETGETLWLTQDIHSHCASWEVGDEAIAFSSKHKGTEHLYKIDLQLLKIVQQAKGTYVSFQVDQGKSMQAVYVPLTTGKDTSYSQPSYSYSTGVLAGVASYSGKKELVIVNERKAIPNFTGIQGVDQIHWFDPREILISFEKEPTKVFRYNTERKDTQFLFSVQDKIISLAGNRDEVFAVTNKGFQAYDMKAGLGSFYPMAMSVCKVQRMNRLSFLVTDSEGKLGYANFNNNDFKPVSLGSGYSQSVCSKNQNYVIYQSSVLGGLQIKKIPYPFR
jgi:hypothetical protein